MTTRTETVEKTIYVATDGTEFSNSEACVQYEADLILKSFNNNYPYVCINETGLGEVVLDDKTAIIKDYFHIIDASRLKIYKAEVRSESDIYCLIAFCEARAGIKAWTKEDFKLGERYIICTKDSSTRIDGYREEVYLEEYNKILGYYENLLEYIRSIF